MNDPLINVSLITENEGEIISAHCSGCTAGLAESCSHVASTIIYIECWARVNGKMACTQVKCSWLLPTYVNEVTYERVKDIDFTSALAERKPWHENWLPRSKQSDFAWNSTMWSTDRCSFAAGFNRGDGKILWSTSSVVLTLIDPYVEKFVVKSRNVLVLSDLYDSSYLELDYPGLLQKCADAKIMLSDEYIKIVEQDTRDQAKGPGFFRHRAGWIGAFVSGAVYHSNVAQRSQSPSHLYKVNTKAIKHGCKFWRICY